MICRAVVTGSVLLIVALLLTAFATSLAGASWAATIRYGVALVSIGGLLLVDHLPLRRRSGLER